MVARGKNRLDWKVVVEKAVEVVEGYNRRGRKPSVRTVFYRLYSVGVLPCTKSAYKRLSAKLVEARKQRLIPFDAFRDETRIVLGELWDAVPEADIDGFKKKLEERLEELDIISMIDSFFDPLKPFVWAGRWAGQSTVVEVWVEKEAFAPTVKDWTLGCGVPIRVNRGYPSWTFIFVSVKELREVLKRHERVVVLYLGDLDPSGVDIERFIGEALDFFKVPPEKVTFQRLAITEDQVRKFGLPPKPTDAATLAKLQRDPRTKSYAIPYVVELEAFEAYAEREFERLVREAVDNHLDEEVYEEMKEKERKLNEELDEALEEVKGRALKKVEEVLGEM